MPRRAFRVEEANALLPAMERVLARLEGWRDAARARADQLLVLELLWGARLDDPACPDHAERAAHRAAVESAAGEMRRLVEEEITARGIRFPPGGLEHGLLDFPTTWRGPLGLPVLAEGGAGGGGVARGARGVRRVGGPSPRSSGPGWAPTSRSPTTPWRREARAGSGKEVALGGEAGEQAAPARSRPRRRGGRRRPRAGARGRCRTPGRASSASQRTPQRPDAVRVPVLHRPRGDGRAQHSPAAAARSGRRSR
jgi:hypothetical protein